jgi:ATP adenylyltransferase
MRVLDKNRQRYAKKIGKFKICELCSKKNIKKQECKSLSTEHWMVFVNKYPYLDGNLMIIPRRHLKSIESLSEDEWKDLQKAIKGTKKALSKIFKTRDFNIGLNIGKKAGCSLEHMHWQIIPRNYGPVNWADIFAEIHVVKISPWDLKKLIDKNK